MTRLWLGLEQKQSRTPLLVGLSIKNGKIQNNTLFGTTLVRVGQKYRENTLIGVGFVKIRAKIEKIPFVARLWLGLVQK